MGPLGLVGGEYGCTGVGGLVTNPLNGDHFTKLGDTRNTVEVVFLRTILNI